MYKPDADSPRSPIFTGLPAIPKKPKIRYETPDTATMCMQPAPHIRAYSAVF